MRNYVPDHKDESHGKILNKMEDYIYLFIPFRSKDELMARQVQSVQFQLISFHCCLCPRGTLLKYNFWPTPCSNVLYSTCTMYKPNPNLQA